MYPSLPVQLSFQSIMSCNFNVKCQIPNVKCQMSDVDVRCQMWMSDVDVKCQMLKEKCQKSKTKRQKTNDKRQKTNVKCQCQYQRQVNSLHYRLRSIKRGQFRFSNFASHFKQKSYFHFLIH